MDLRKLYDLQDDRTLYDLPDGTNLTPTSLLVYKQWTIDADAELLTSGYIRTQYVNNKNNPLGNDVKCIIKKYYDKKFKKKELNRRIAYKLESISREKDLQKYIREERIENIKKCLAKYIYYIGPVFVVTLSFAPDIAAIIINIGNECHLTILKSRSIHLNISQFLIIGSLIHLIGITLPLHIIWTVFCITNGNNGHPKWRKCVNGIWCLILFVNLFIFSWSIIGFILYSNMTKQTQCGHITISWSILKIFEVTLLHPSLLWLYYYLQEERRRDYAPFYW